MYFYELHESDDELFADVIVAHDSEYDEDEFLELVLEARAAVIDRFEEDSLIEAVANELERKHGFVHIDERQLRAAVNVSANDDETVLTPVDQLPQAPDREADDFRTMLVEVEAEDRPWSDN